MTAAQQRDDIPLCVDLDGTLIRSDLLIESALGLIRRNPLNILRCGAWLLRGKAAMKREIAARSEVDVSLLPYDDRVVDRLRDSSRHRVLCTASDRKYADAVAAHLGVFDEVIASDGERNLAGSNKAQALVELYGERGFDYAGNAAPDLKVWQYARSAIVVNASDGLARRAAAVTSVEQVLPHNGGGLRTWIKALRLHQWLKNLLVFLPLLASHKLFQVEAVVLSLLAFVSFGLCASGVYVLNDLLDLESDRNHPRKRLRPFAAGTLALASGLVAAPALTVAAFALAIAVGAKFAIVLFGYWLLTLAYSFRLKRIAMLDTVVLAALYTVRIIAGTVAIHSAPSFWLLAFSMFLFLSLALVKRYTELRSLLQQGRSRTDGRGYETDDLSLIQSLGGASGYLAVLVLALYINSSASEVLYRHQQVLWLLCPLLLYWVSRVWLKAHRGLMDDDPVVFALTDYVSRVVLALCAIVIVVAI
ncbi:MAG: UbiA family prenyltransferase [Rudaea sp.]|uniref:UbiA family prenyltransferase n=1 Tax=unclassified Rudaea TaxID=2627037 RepID=UPI0010F7C50E|nr:MULTISPECIES: UbiA family prenyltransferase [unclassified Rudaea]MBN8887170.1 UbiA family prenyltransferase [Rudaea sp.]MBR0344739.1 UbiA family prenyltransferase [Rudaea sp.]